ncbi:MAG: Acg family FMN-binding oxidoreductase [Clostridia bacterium]
MTTKIAPPPPKRAPMIDGWYVARDGDKTFPSGPMERLAYYARLAPSSHNSQPWRFVAGAGEIDVFADMERWMPAIDPDKRELHISLGCAIEAIRIAADHAGWGSSVAYFPVEHDQTLVARVNVALQGPKRDMSASDLLPRILSRRTSHNAFDPGKPVSDADRKRLYACFQAGDVSLHFLQERAGLDALSVSGARADAALFARPGYREELGRYVGGSHLGGSWLASRLGELAFGHLPVAAQVRKEDVKRLASAPLVALLSTRKDTRIDQVQAGEAYMRIALVAEAHDVRVQPVSQLLEVEEARHETAQIFQLGDRVAQHLFRLGHAEPDESRRPRRALDEMVIRGSASG